MAAASEQRTPSPAIRRRLLVAHAAALLLAVAAVYAGVVRFDFADYDDRTYVSENPHVQQGLALETVRWAFTSTVVSHWHPLTMLSHAADWSLFGAWAGGHHLTSVLLHAVNALLLLAFLARTTGAPGRSAFVAALFAVHPLHVESVAWVAERKDVLSTCGYLLALHAWVGWARRPTAGRYAAVLLAFAAGLLAKSMVVTLPLGLLVLDRWPLRRTLSWRRAVLEKLPLFALAALAAVAAVLAARGGATEALAAVPLRLRIENAVVSLAWYLVKAVWPSDLAVLYLHPAAPGGTPLGTPAVLGSTLALLAVTALVLRRPRRPYLVAGWLFYLVTLLPVLGLVQAGIQAHADRYTYLALVGPWIMVVWGVADWAGARAAAVRWRRAAAGLGLAATLAYALVARAQVAVWRSAETLYRHAIAVEPDNFMMYFDLATVLGAAGERDEALAAYARSIAINPRYPAVRRAYAAELERAGRVREALAEYEAAARLDPQDAGTERLVGDALLASGSVDAALAAYRRALALDPDDARTHNNAGNALLAAGDAVGARAEYEQALRLAPDLEGVHGNLAGALEGEGRWAEALPHRRAQAERTPVADAEQALAVAALRAGREDEALAASQAALAREPERREALQLAAWLLATRREATAADGAAALAYARRFAALGEPDAVGLVTLAAAEAAAGRFGDARTTAARARAAAAGDASLLAVLDAMDARFARDEPYREAEGS